MKASLTEKNIILHVDFAESYRNDQQDVIQSAYFLNQSFSIFTVCCYTKPVGSDDLQSDNIVVVTESSDHNRLTSITCLQKVLGKIAEQYEKVYNNAFVSNDGMSAQFRSRFIFRLLAGTVMPEKSLSWFYN